MSDDRKTAEAAVKAAQRVWDGASTKAAKARETYISAQEQANLAARVLTHAKANPALFNDNPLEVVLPEPVWDVTDSPHAGPSGAQVGKVHILPAPTPPPEVLEQRQAAVAEQAAAQDDVTPGNDDDAPPWTTEPIPEAKPAPTPRKRRIAAKPPAEAAPPEPVQQDAQKALAAAEGLPVDVTGLQEVPDGDEPAYEEDGDGFAAPVAPGSPLSPF